MTLNPSVGRCRGCVHLGLSRIARCGERVYRVDLTSSVSSGNSIMDDFYLFISALEQELGCSIEYLVVQTREGNGVLHCLFNCPFLHKDIVSNLWSRFHHGFVVTCKCVDDISGSKYKIGSYLSFSQSSFFVGFDVSRNWFSKKGYYDE